MTPLRERWYSEETTLLAIYTRPRGKTTRATTTTCEVVPLPTMAVIKKMSKTSEGGVPKQNLIALSLALFVSGSILGTLLDCIHSWAGVQKFHNGLIKVGSLDSNVWVPLLTGSFFWYVGLLNLYLEHKLVKSKPPVGNLMRSTWVAFITLALFFGLSAELYRRGVPSHVEACVLFGVAGLIWFFLDGTWLGLALACFNAIHCPLSEIPLNQQHRLWSYPNADIQIHGEGIHSWSLACYIVYTPFLINLSRWLKVVFTEVQDDHKRK